MGSTEGLGGSPGRGDGSKRHQALSLVEPETPVTSLSEAPRPQAVLSHHFTTHLGATVLQWPKSIKELKSKE